MDPVTHLTVAGLVRQLASKRKGALAVMLLSALLPDFDYATLFWGKDLFLRYHRGPTHSVAAAVAAAIVIGLIVGRRKDFRPYAALAFTGYMSHIALDVINTHGTSMLWPLDDTRYALRLFSPIDITMTAIPLVAIIWALKNKARARLILISGAAALCLFIASHAYTRGLAYNQVRAELPAHRIKKVVPMPNSLFRWWFIALDKGGRVDIGIADLFSRRVYKQESLAPMASGKDVESSGQTRVIRDFAHFSEFSYVSIADTPTGTEVTWRDLVFAYLPGERYTVRQRFDHSGKLLSTEIKL